MMAMYSMTPGITSSAQMPHTIMMMPAVLIETPKVPASMDCGLPRDSRL